PPVQAKAVLGGTAKLPCDINPPLLNDSAILVVWYKAPERSSDIIPIYRPSRSAVEDEVLSV
ncbi:hypothetical protein PV325_008914, partial [Microctonus aethiopoides]